jgi:hypothetical protein
MALQIAKMMLQRSHEQRSADERMEAAADRAKAEADEREVTAMSQEAHDMRVAGWTEAAFGVGAAGATFASGCVESAESGAPNHGAAQKWRALAGGWDAGGKIASGYVHAGEADDRRNATLAKQDADRDEEMRRRAQDWSKQAQEDARFTIDWLEKMVAAQPTNAWHA